MKTKSSLPLKKWLWMIALYIGCCGIGLVLCSAFINSGYITLDGSNLVVMLVVFIGSVLIGLLSKGLPVLGVLIPIGIVMLLHTAVSILVFQGVGDGFLLQMIALVLGGLLGYWICNKKRTTPKRKQRRRISS